MQRRGPEWRLWSEGFPPSLSGPSEKSGGEVGCCEVTSIILLNDSSGVGGVKGEEQNAGVDHKGHKKKDPVRVQVQLCTFIRQGKVSLMSFTVTLRQSKRQKESGRKDRKIERPVISHFSELRC